MKNPDNVSAEDLRREYVDALGMLSEQAKTIAALWEALRANVSARREILLGCCDWSCDLCAPLAGHEGPRVAAEEWRALADTTRRIDDRDERHRALMTACGLDDEGVTG